jgi:formiminotetrahydrofolate cyclodeaminase
MPYLIVNFIIMEIIHRIASHAPVPAGGAAVANSFCLAVALVYKVVLFETERNLHNPDISSNLINVRKEIERLLRDAEKLVEEDSEAYLNFARSRRNGDTVQMKLHFDIIIEVSMKIMEKSEAAFEWIQQLHQISPQHMATHLLVASELLMGSINGTVHVARDNLKSIRVPEKRENYLNRLNELHKTYQRRYHKIMEKISAAPDELNP